jgi:succinyl-diaminopimelate desuccinylase
MSGLIELAKALIAKPSITPDDQGCQTLIAQRLGKCGFACQSFAKDQVDNLWAKYGHASPLLVFAGHTDVVPPGPLAAWHSPPFSPSIRDGHLYGRGAADMKGAIAAMIVAVEKLLSQHKTLKGSIAFLITSDEEGQAIAGTQYVVEQLLAKHEQIDFCIVGEASSEQTLGDQIRIGRRGSLHGTLVIKGKQGHIAFPELAINPIPLALAPLQTLVNTVWDQGDDYFPATSFQISNIHAGTGASNVIPEAITIQFNWRYNPQTSVQDIQAKTTALLQQSELNYTLDWQVGALPYFNKETSFANMVNQAICDVTGKNAKATTGGGTSDGRFISQMGAQVIELGLIHKTVHQVNECIATCDLELLADIYYRILTLVLVER